MASTDENGSGLLEMGIITDITSDYSKKADDLVNRGVEAVGQWTGLGKQLEQQWQDFSSEMSRSWVYDDREPISGEAKTLHPFQFLDLTPLRWLGVTRLPMTAAKGVELGVKGAKALSKAKIPQKIATWKTSIKANSKNLGRGAAAGAALAASPKLLTKTGKTVGKATEDVMKNPKKAGALAGTLIGSSMNTGSQTQPRDLLTGQTTMTSYRKRIDRKTWLA